MIGVLEDLLTPYARAMEGRATPIELLREDDVYASLLGGSSAQPMQRPPAGVPGIPGAGQFGGDIEIIYGGNNFNPSSADSSHGGHLHFAAQQGPVVKLLRHLQSLGFSVSENKAFDQVDPVHTDNSWHYMNKHGQNVGQGNRAGDISYNGGGRWGNEAQALNWLEQWLVGMFG